MKEVHHATPEDFDAQLVSAPNEVVVAYFWGPDCPNCDVFARDLPALLEALPANVKLIKVNAYEHTDLARRFGLFGVPAFIVFKGGQKLGMMREYYGREYWQAVIDEKAGVA